MTVQVLAVNHGNLHYRFHASPLFPHRATRYYFLNKKKTTKKTVLDLHSYFAHTLSTRNTQCVPSNVDLNRQIWWNEFCGTQFASYKLTITNWIDTLFTDRARNRLKISTESISKQAIWHGKLNSATAFFNVARKQPCLRPLYLLRRCWTTTGPEDGCATPPFCKR